VNEADRDEGIEPRAPDRRSWLRAGALALGILPFAPLLRMFAAPGGQQSAEFWLLDLRARLGRDSAALEELGIKYLDSHPSECAAIARLLCRGDGRATGLRLGAQIARDWSARDIAIVDGWVLARTEARICAMLHLYGAKA
jgi:hypothetical protein